MVDRFARFDQSDYTAETDRFDRDVIVSIKIAADAVPKASPKNALPK
jgi:hypothetical protein